MGILDNQGSENDSHAIVFFTFADGWHGYPDTPGTAASGFVPTKVTFEFPEGLVTVGDVLAPEGGSVYEGHISIRQKFNHRPGVSGQFTIKAKVSFQVCNDQMCLPPDSIEMETVITIR